jgi:glycosyltransferase involved in cell wall biosynthesis
MKAIFINAFGLSEENRVEPIIDLFNKNYWETEYLISNYNHNTKKVEYKNNVSKKYISVPKYKKNISIKRLYSHLIFSLKVVKIVKQTNPNLVYIKLPPNLLLKKLSHLKKKYKFILIVDIFDLWPESFVGIHKVSMFELIPLNIWRNFRDKFIENADEVIVECNLYKKELQITDAKLLYLTKKDYISDLKPILLDNVIKFCYLGGINSLIDIEIISKLLDQINVRKKVEIHIIGDGNNKGMFISALNKFNISVFDYGPIYNISEKKYIMSLCHFGLNIMKKKVFVALTLKSIEYLMNGLPLINNIKNDTYEIVEHNRIGFNIDDTSSVIEKIISMNNSEYQEMRIRSRVTYNKLFSLEKYNHDIEKIFNVFLKRGNMNV